MRVLAVVLVLAIPSGAQAQPERYELGCKLKTFEAAWEKFEAKFKEDPELRTVAEGYAKYRGARR